MDLMETKPTPAPWDVREGTREAEVYGNGRHVLTVEYSTAIAPAAEDRANAHFIVRAVNSHDALVAALERIVCLRVPAGDIQNARNAIVIKMGDIAAKALNLAKGTTDAH